MICFFQLMIYFFHPVSGPDFNSDYLHGAWDLLDEMKKCIPICYACMD